MLVGCLGYKVEPGRLLLTDVNDLSVSEIRGAVWAVLEEQGFEDLGLDEEMMQLLGISPTDVETVDSFRAYLLREYTYLHNSRDLRVEVIDYTDEQLERSTFQYSPPEEPFFEIAVYEFRPGGFSRSGHRFFDELENELRQSLPVALTVVTEPPETRVGEYWSITLISLFFGATLWLLTFGASSALFGLVLVFMLSRDPDLVGLKRIIFTIGNTWLSAPLPFPAATILVIPLPHVFAFPWNNWDFYSRVLDVAVYSFPVAFLLSAVVSLKLFTIRQE